jgi:hypothetical protein
MPDDQGWLSLGEGLLIALDRGAEPDEWAGALETGVIGSSMRNGHRVLRREDVECWARRHGWSERDHASVRRRRPSWPTS